MSTIEDLQKWYLSQCNEDWEHTYGVTIGTLDNPGWSLTVDLSGTNLEGVAFSEHSYGAEDEGDTSGPEWLICKVENGKFVGYGGPQKLEEMIDLFLSWAKSNT